MATFISSHCRYFKFSVWVRNVQEKLNHVQQNRDDVYSTLEYLRTNKQTNKQTKNKFTKAWLLRCTVGSNSDKCAVVRGFCHHQLSFCLLLQLPPLQKPAPLLHLKTTRLSRQLSLGVYGNVTFPAHTHTQNKSPLSLTHSWS
jgi:hypothetical protein